MKTTLFVVGAMATAAAAQDASLSGFDTLPDCGQTCITNMINLAEDLGCTGSDVACLCLNPNFSYGVRDCTDQSCQSNQDALDTQSWAIDICANQGVAVTSTSSDINVSTRSGATPSTLDESTDTGVISVTSSVTATVSTSGSVITTVVPTVVPITGSSTGVVRTSTTASTTTTQKPSQTGNGDDNNGDDNNGDGNNGDGNNGDGNNDDSNGDGDNAARATAVPIGIMAFAGVAALLL